MSSSPQIYIGGWARFREECHVTKKEPMEDFSWMAQQESTFKGLTWSITNPAEFEDCREALKRVEGAREYLKTYVAKEEGEGINFRDPIGEQIVLSSHHSGCSYYSMLWTYKHLLNDWDGWVLGQKEYAAYEEYEKIQLDPASISSYYRQTTACIQGQRNSWSLSPEKLIEKSLELGVYATSIEEFHAVLELIYKENVERKALLDLEYKKRAHNDLVGGLKWKYKHPVRWFDTPWGSSLSPVTPQYITPEAYTEMEALYPGYRKHIEQVQRALYNYRLPDAMRRYSPAGEKFTKDFLAGYGITV